MADGRDTDATHILSEDHRTVEDLFEKYENAKGKDAKEALARQICDELKIHAMVEEEIFYPALRGKIEDDLLNEAYVEHDGAKVLINEIAPMAALPSRNDTGLFPVMLSCRDVPMIPWHFGTSAAQHWNRGCFPAY